MVITILFLLIGAGFFFYGRHINKISRKIDSRSDKGVGYGMLGSILFIGTLVAQITLYSNLVSIENSYRVIDTKVSIARERAQSIVDKLKEEAAGYLHHEQNIFGNLTPENCKLLLVQYPQLRASEPVKALMDEISKLNDTIYQLKFTQQDYRAELLTAKQNVFCAYSPDIK